MEGVFTEFENENSLRMYPFAAGCIPTASGYDIPTDVFIDAALYPVNPSGSLYLSSISADGVYSISDNLGVIMTGVPKDNYIEFYDTTPLSRHVGTMIASSALALKEFTLISGNEVVREYTSENTAFASSCVFPVIIDGVTSISVGDTGYISDSVEFANNNNDIVRVSGRPLPDGRKTMRFDVVPRPASSSSSIKRIICVVDGQTPFRIFKHELSCNTIVLYLDNIDREAVCIAANRQNDFEMADTCACSCEASAAETVAIPEAYHIEEIFIPPSGECDPENAFYIVTPNMTGYVNPVSITLDDGDMIPKVNEPEIVVDGLNADLAEGALLDEVSDRKVVIQVPGLSGGLV